MEDIQGDKWIDHLRVDEHFLHDDGGDDDSTEECHLLFLDG